MEIYKKLDKAREAVRNTTHTKDGKGGGGKYAYFKPETVELIVAEVCKEQGILPLCSLKRDEHGLYQEMVLINLGDDKDKIVFTLATEKGAVMSANDTQQLGSTDTYSERYIKMKVFQIKDNNLDPDSQGGAQAKQADDDDLDF